MSWSNAGPAGGSRRREPGRGRSEPLPRYSFGAMAAAVAEVVPAGPPVAVLGHSLGGVVALTLASGWFGVRVSGACGLGIKVRWRADELARAAEQAKRPAKVFGSRAEAAARWPRVSGLSGLVAEDSPVVDSGLAEGWRLALDQAASGIGVPDLDGLLAAARAPVVLAAGEHTRCARPTTCPRTPAPGVFAVRGGVLVGCG